jgi:translation initiation factor IF-3
MGLLQCSPATITYFLLTHLTTLIAGFKPFTPRPQNNAQGNQNRGRRPVKENPNRINNEITAPTVRVVGDNVEPNLVLPIAKAIALADEMELDLVEISPNAEPPVCRIVDYQKFLYQQKKKQKEIKAKQTKVVIKEIRFGPQTDEHDFNFKLRHAENFIKEGAKVKAYVFFRGRSIVFKEQGEILLLRFATALEEIAKVEVMPTLEGKKMNMILAPKPKKN